MFYICDFLLTGFILLEVNTGTYNNTRTFDTVRSYKESIHAEQGTRFTLIFRLFLHNKISL